MQKRKISLVFEETGLQGGKAFNFYMTGQDRNIGAVPPDERSAAEWHAYQAFQIYINILAESGMIQTVNDNKPKGKGH